MMIMPAQAAVPGQARTRKGRSSDFCLLGSDGHSQPITSGAMLRFRFPGDSRAVEGGIPANQISELSQDVSNAGSLGAHGVNGKFQQGTCRLLQRFAFLVAVGEPVFMIP